MDSPDGGHVYPTFEQAWNYVSTVDNNHDGHPDNDEHTAKEILWGAFDFPDYVWFQSAGAFSEEFRPTQSGCDFLSPPELERICGSTLHI